MVQFCTAVNISRIFLKVRPYRPTTRPRVCSNCIPDAITFTQGSGVDRRFLSRSFNPKPESSLFTYSNFHIHKCRLRELSKSANTVQTSHSEQLEEFSDLLQQRYVFVKTSMDRWIDVENVVFDVCYLDSLKGTTQTNSRAPTVVALHDVRGNFRDLVDIVTPFIKLGCRVVVPALPGSAETKGDDPFDERVFTHTASEKAEFVGDFLYTLGIYKVDLLITVGSSSHTGILLSAGASSMFRSLALVSPWGTGICRGMKPLWFHQLMEASQEWRLTKLMSFLATWAVALAGKGSWSHRRALALARNIVFCNMTEVGGNCLLLHQRAFPVCIVYTDGDKYVEEDISAEVLSLLSIPESSITVCHHDGKGDSQKDSEDSKTCAFKLEGFGENYLQTASGVISKYLLEHLKSVRHVS